MPIRIIHLFALQLFFCCSLCSTEQVVDHCWALSNFLCAASEAGIHELPTRQSGHSPHVVLLQDGHIHIFQDGELVQEIVGLVDEERWMCTTPAVQSRT